MLHPRNINSEYEKYFVSNVDYEKNGFKNKIGVSLKLLYSFEAKRKIEKLIKKEQPDIVHLHNIHHQITPSILYSFKKSNIPVIMTLHDYKMVCPSYSMLSDGKICEACKCGGYYRCFLKSCVKNSHAKSLLNTIEMYLHHKILHIYNLIDIFISPSQFLKNKVKEMGMKGNVVYLPYFIDVEAYCPSYDWEENTIVYFGRLSREKGLFTLLEAMKGFSNITLKIIGEGPIRESLELEVRSLKLKNVRFLGYMSGVPLKEEIRKSMFVIVPSEWYENYPFVIIEGFALGKPVIGSRIGGIPELVRDNETGLTFEPGNAEDLSEKIKAILADSSSLIKMGENARRFVETELNPEKHYQRLMEIYSRVIVHNL